MLVGLCGDRHVPLAQTSSLCDKVQSTLAGILKRIRRFFRHWQERVWCLRKKKKKKRGVPPTGVCACMTLHQSPYFEGGDAWLANKAGWLSMHEMYVKSEPQAFYLLAGACKLDGLPVAPSMLVGLFPSATDIVPLPPPDEQPMPDKVQSTLAGILKRHQETSLRHWQDDRVWYCQCLVQDLEEKWHSLRRSRASSEERARVRADLIEAEKQEMDAERDWLQDTVPTPELEVTAFFDLEWSVLAKAE